MGLRGPAPKPSARKKVEGTYRKDRAPKQEAQPGAAVPDPPDWFTDGARAEWDRIVPELERIGLAKGVDYWLLVAYCEGFDRYQELGRFLSELPRADRYQESGKSGWRATIPEVTERAALVQELSKLAAKIGLSPSDRTRVEATPPKNDGADERMRLIK